MTSKEGRGFRFGERLLQCRTVANTLDQSEWAIKGKRRYDPASPVATNTSSVIFVAAAELRDFSPRNAEVWSNAATAGSEYSQSDDIHGKEEAIGGTAQASPVPPRVVDGENGGGRERIGGQSHGSDHIPPLGAKRARSHWAVHAPAEFTTAVDMSPSLCSAFLCYADEIAATTLAPKGTEEPLPRQGGSYAYDSIRLRLFPTNNICSQSSGRALQEWGEPSAALAWLLQHQPEVAATTLLMGFSFLLGLRRHLHSWKKALEVPIMALQLLANHAFIINECGGSKTLGDLTARDHLLLMSACLLVTWKYADVNAAVEDLVDILDNQFFDQRVLGSGEVLRFEAVVLKSVGLCVAPPRWWRVAIEFLASAHNDEIEWASRICDTRRSSAFVSGVKSCYEKKLQRLLISGERVLLFVMDKAESGDPLKTRGGKSDACPKACEGSPLPEGVRRRQEVRCSLCEWLHHHPLFGVALAVASNAVTGGWAAARIGPAAAGGNQAPLIVADTAAQREMMSMVALLVGEVL